jgi:hypothetical protein
VNNTLCGRRFRSFKVDNTLCGRRFRGFKVANTLCGRRFRSFRVDNTLCGRRFRNHRGVFVSKGGAVQVKNREELEKVISDLLKNEKRRQDLGEKALGVVRENLGAIDRTVDLIAENLRGSGVYVSDK